jgi:hypothetical protein
VTPTRCPTCGTELTASDAAGARTRATGISSGWEALRDVVAPPGTISALVEGCGEAGPTWWLPSLLYLAYMADDRADARAALDEFASRRDELAYAVVEERTDDIIGFSIQPWPLLDDRGRLRFPIGEDPVQAEVTEADLEELLSAHRHRWHALGLLPAELLERRVHIGDAYAMVVSDEADPTESLQVRVLPHGDGPGRYLGGLPAQDSCGSVGVPVVDITWDAREAGKLAHYAAAAGVIDPDAPDPTVAAVARETEARYMIGYRDGVDPRDVRIVDSGGDDAGDKR